MLQPLGIDHVLLLVRGLDRAIAFYVTVVGAEDVGRLDSYAMAELRVGSAQIDLVDIEDARGAWARPPVAAGRNIDHFCVRLEATPEAELRAHLAALGVPIIEEQRHAGPPNMLSLYVRDPSDNVVELKAAIAS